MLTELLVGFGLIQRRPTLREQIIEQRRTEQASAALR